PAHLVRLLDRRALDALEKKCRGVRGLCRRQARAGPDTLARRTAERQGVGHGVARAKRKGRLREAATSLALDQDGYCFCIVSSVFLADFFFVCFLLILVSLLLIVSPLVAAGAVEVLPALSWAKAVEDKKARAAVAMISLRIGRTSVGGCDGLPQHHNGTR